MIQYDCFGYHKTMSGECCSALRKLYCRNEECKFYKPLEECEADPLSFNYLGEENDETA